MMWRGSDLRKEDVAFDFSRAPAAALEDVLLCVRNARLSVADIKPEHCRHPALDNALAHVFNEVGPRLIVRR